MKNLSKPFIYLLVAGVLFIAGIISMHISTCNLINHSKENNKEFKGTLADVKGLHEKYMKSDSTWVHFENQLINGSIQQLTNYEKLISESSQTISNSLILWATTLTMLSIVFTFWGMIEIKETFDKVNLAKGEIDISRKEIKTQIENITAAQGELGATKIKIGEIYDKYETMYSDLKRRALELEDMCQLLEDTAKTTDDSLRNSFTEMNQLVEDTAKTTDASLKKTFTSVQSFKKELNKYMELFLPTYTRMLSYFASDNRNDQLSQFLALRPELDKLPEHSEDLKMVKNSLLTTCNIKIAKIYSDRKAYAKAKEILNPSKNIEDKFIKSRVHRNLGVVEFNLNCIIDRTKPYCPKKIVWNNLMTYFEFSVAINKNDARSYRYLGVIHTVLGDYGKAIEFESKAIEIDNAHPSGYNNRGIAHFLNYDNESAIKDFNEAQLKDHLEPRTHLNLFEYYLVIGNSEMAKHSVKKAKFHNTFKTQSRRIKLLVTFYEYLCNIDTPNEERNLSKINQELNNCKIISPERNFTRIVEYYKSHRCYKNIKRIAEFISNREYNVLGNVYPSSSPKIQP